MLLYEIYCQKNNKQEVASFFGPACKYITFNFLAYLLIFFRLSVKLAKFSVSNYTSMLVYTLLTLIIIKILLPDQMLSKCVLHQPKESLIESLLSLRREKVRLANSLLTGHGHLRKYLQRLKLLTKEPLSILHGQSEKAANTLFWVWGIGSQEKEAVVPTTSNQQNSPTSTN